MLQALCDICGIQYFRILHPNQYLPGSKVLTQEEKETVYREEKNACQIAVEMGYPLLVEIGSELISQGVRFYDFSMLFADVRESIDSDPCCHYNDRGYQLLGQAIGKTILALNSQNAS